MIRFMIWTIAILLFSGCGGATSSSQAMPSWYLNSPQNNTTQIYGTGEATNKKEAINNALADMSANLIVSVKSKIETTTTNSSSTGYLKDSSKQVITEAKKITFTNAKIKNIKNISTSIYVLMSVDREELFRIKKKEFDQEHNFIEQKYNNIIKRSKMGQIKALIKLEPKLTKAKNKSFVLFAINNRFNYEPYFTKYQNYIDKIDRLKSKLIISLDSNEIFFYNVIASQLNSQNYRLSKMAPDIRINISNQVRYSRARGWHIAKVSSTILARSGGKLLSTNTINTIGRSSSSRANALNDASRQFDDKVKKIGIEKILFEK